MATGLASPKDNPLNRVYFTISNKRYNGELKNNGSFTIAAPAKQGQYNLFIHTADGDLTDVKDSITIIKAAQ